MSASVSEGRAPGDLSRRRGAFDPWLLSAAVLCFLYGLLLVALIHTTADGSWYWYATALRSGQHLYRDLHLPLQPLYPLELSLLQRALGTSWIAQQSIGIVNLMLFLLALFLVDRRTRLATWQRALLLCCSFVTCMAFIMMRFDDFHVVATSIELLCAWLLLNLGRQNSVAQRIGIYSALGILCGACMLLRINDGTFLFGAVLCVAVTVNLAQRQPLWALLALPICTAMTIVVVIASLGESLADWWFYSIRTAAAIKGGSSHLLLYPLRLPLGTLRELTRDWRTLALSGYALLLGAIAWWWTSRSRTVRQRWTAVALAVLPAIALARNIVRGNAARVMVAFAVFAIYASVILVCWRLYSAVRGRAKRGWSPWEMLLLIPLAQLVSVSLSGARWYPNTNPPAALFLILLPIALPWAFRRSQVRAIFFTWIALLTLSGAIDKVRNPFDWFNYRARSVNATRVWLQHPAFGPMLIEKEQLALVEPICSAVNAGSSPRELLSLPFTYPNYFCNVPPWHGYVQTFYDLSGPQMIRSLETELLSHPPQWIVYQRQLDILSRNEEAFNLGHPLPHRGLDELIEHKLSTGEWKATVLPSPNEDTSTWLLIQTPNRSSSEERPRVIASR